jgi:radical SAM protein with 4Fe4S-binding SPASM domain
MKSSRESGSFLSLAPHCALKRLETPSLYDIRADELYELDDEAFSFLASGPPVTADSRTPEADELVRTCLDEGIVNITAARHPLTVPSAPRPPTLRFLLVHITDRCNLKCRHCFLGKPQGGSLEIEEILRLAGEFTALQGMRFIVSGGEPLLHPRFRELNEAIGDYPFRAILLTNGTLIDGETARALRFHEVQISIDGLEESHDLIRGRGSYRRALNALELLAAAGVDLSVATMVHAANLDEFGSMKEILGKFPLKSWSVDVPCLTGNMAGSRALAAEPEQAAARMSFSFGGGYYGSSGGYACGAHLAAVMADGSICKCGHYGDHPAGRVGEGLAAVWRRMRPTRLDELSCRCSQLESCRGGCRYRAELFSCVYNSDPIQCFARGVPVGGDLMYASATRKKGGELS